MPKKNPPHPVRTVRKIMGKTQREMADILEITRSRLAQIETGILPMSREMAKTVLSVSGAIVPEGYGETGEEPVYLPPHEFFELQPFTEDAFHEWKYICGDNSDSIKDEYIDILAHGTVATLTAAQELGKLQVVAKELVLSMIQSGEDHGLSDIVQKILQSSNDEQSKTA